MSWEEDKAKGMAVLLLCAVVGIVVWAFWPQR
jgi:cbb3-type cytochrome oxidase subunit 3